MSFAEIAGLVGGLPSSATASRQRWANSIHTQALAWREGGFHVEQVYPDRARVRFELGPRGATRVGSRTGTDSGGPGRAVTSRVPLAMPAREPIDTPVGVHVVLQWLDAGTVTLDGAGKPAFPALDPAPGLYRMTFTGADLSRPKIYIGETDNLRRRLSDNYRSPVPSQQTSLRINTLLREHLAAAGAVALAIATRADLQVSGAETRFDLTRKATRLLAENAALISQQIRDDADIANVG